MLKYEVFRQSIVGWSLLFTILLFIYPYLDIQDFSKNSWLIGLLLAITSSPIIGYLINQCLRSYYILKDNRPNDKKIKIVYLYENIKRIIESKEELSNNSSVLKSFLSLIQEEDGLKEKDLPKNLHRILWVTYANNNLRERSESYWERYYTNIEISISIFIGTLISILILTIPNIGFNENSLNIDLIIRVLITLFILALLVWALFISNRKYLAICVYIENTWIDKFLIEFKNNPDYFNKKIFAI